MEITNKELASGEKNSSLLEKLLEDDKLLVKFKTDFDNAASDVTKGVLEGASRFRQILKVFRNILLLPW